MYIKKLILQHFGKYHKQEMELHKGINLIYGPNEAGKTTIKDFVIGMFYGIERQRGIAARTDEYIRREPLEGGDYSGSMELEQEGKVYLIDRIFRKDQRSVRVFQQETGREISLGDSQSLQGILVDMDRNGYINTLCISSHGAAYKQELQEEFRQYLMNVSTTRTSNLNLKDAYSYLNNQKKQLNRKGMDNELQSLSRKITDIHLEEELEAIGKEREQLEEQLLRISGQTQPSDRQEPEEDEEKKKPFLLRMSKEEKEYLDPQLKQIIGFIKILLIFGIFALVLLLVSLLPVSLYYKGWLSVILLVVTAYLWIRKRLKRKDNKKKSAGQTRETVSADIRQGAGQKEKEAQSAAPVLDYSRQLADLQVRENDLLKENAKVQELEARYRELKKRIREAEEETAAIELAYTTIQELAGNIYDQYGAGINKQVSDMVSRITGGQYTDVILDEQLNIKVRKNQQYLGTEFLSTGTLEQIYLAVRLSVAAQMSQAGMPLMLDDIFGSYDDARLEAVLMCLAEYPAEQVILFTANDRLADVLDRTDMEYTFIEV